MVKKKKTGEKPQLETKVAKVNISQAGIIRALKARGYEQTTQENPFCLEREGRTILVHEDTVTIEGTTISVPLGKGAIKVLEKAMKEPADEAA